MENQEELQKAFMAYLIQDAAAREFSYNQNRIYSPTPNN